MLVGCKQYAGDVANEIGFSLWVKPNRLKEFGTFKNNDMEVPSKEEFLLLKKIVTELESQLQTMQSRLLQIEAKPKQWYIQSEACKLFVGRNGKPVDRHTFRKWVLSWIENGDLIVDYNVMRTGDGFLIREDFLKGIYKPNFRKAA